MSYTALTQYNSPNYTPESQVSATFGMPRSIDYITIHWWGDPNAGPTFEGVVSWLCNTRSQVSAHEVATGTDRRSATLVDYANAAWHAGSATGNARSLGIECDPRCRDEDYDVVAEVIADIWIFYGRTIPLRGHNSWVATQCPGNYNLDRLYNEAVAWRDRKLGINQPAPQPVPVPQPIDERPEWLRNLQPYTKDDSGYTTTVKLTVLPAAGVKVTNLNTQIPVNDTIIPRGTQVDIVAKTVVGSTEYLISSYSKSRGMANGIISSALGVPAEPPVQEKPEWLKNLNDITDKTMHTRSETPVLKLADGSVTRRLAINTPVKITHATQIVGIDLLVIDSAAEGIETIYLSDTPVADPYGDIEKRLSLLEKAVKAISDFLASIFSGFRS